MGCGFVLYDYTHHFSMSSDFDFILFEDNDCDRGFAGSTDSCKRICVLIFTLYGFKIMAVLLTPDMFVRSIIISFVRHLLPHR